MWNFFFFHEQVEWSRQNAFKEKWLLNAEYHMWPNDWKISVVQHINMRMKTCNTAFYKGAMCRFFKTNLRLTNSVQKCKQMRWRLTWSVILNSSDAFVLVLHKIKTKKSVRKRTIMLGLDYITDLHLCSREIQQIYYENFTHSDRQLNASCLFTATMQMPSAVLKHGT